MDLYLELRDEELQENTELLVRIGEMLYNGDVVRTDYNEAIRCFKIAGELGNAGGLNNLAWMYQMGEGVEEDLQKAVRIYEEAAQKGHTTAMVNLGNIYESGKLEGEPDYNKAYKYYKHAADLGDDTGLFNYANCLSHGWGIKQNKKKAFKIFMRLALNDYTEANFYVGLFYQDKKMYDKARHFYRKGALGNDPYCYNQLAVMYSTGLGVKIDKVAAYDYYNLASGLGDTLAITNMAYMHEVGDLGEPDLETAIEFYKIATESGEKHAIEALERLKKEGLKCH